MALCVGTGVGVNATLSRSLGRKDYRQASRIAGNAMFLSICYYLAVLLFALLRAEAYLRSQTSDPVIAVFEHPSWLYTSRQAPFTSKYSFPNMRFPIIHLMIVRI